MKLKDIQGIFHKEIDVIYGEEETNSFFFILIEAYYKITRMQLALHPDYKIDSV